MKKQFLLIAFILLISGIIFYSALQQNTTYKKEVVSGFQTFDLSAKEMESLLKKAKTGDGEAAYKISQYYEIYKEDKKQGYYWLKIAANLGQPYAQSWLGHEAYRRHDLKNAIAWYWKAAQQGEANGALEGALYLKQTEDNLSTYTEKAKVGNSKASYRVYKYYFYKDNDLTEGKVKNQSESWLKLTAQQGNADAQYELAERYGWNDQDKAIYWYQKALEQGKPEAKWRLDDLKNPVSIVGHFISVKLFSLFCCNGCKEYGILKAVP